MGSNAEQNNENPFASETASFPIDQKLDLLRDQEQKRIETEEEMKNESKAAPLDNNSAHADVSQFYNDKGGGGAVKKRSTYLERLHGTQHSPVVAEQRMQASGVDYKQSNMNDRGTNKQYLEKRTITYNSKKMVHFDNQV